MIHDLLTRITASNVPTFLRGRIAAPAPYTFPFFEPHHRVLAKQDKRQAEQKLKATITATSPTQCTVTLEHSDTLNGSPTISNTLYGSVTLASGSGLGPYVFNRAAPNTGLGAVIFTAKIPGRPDVTASVEIPSLELDVGSITGTVTAKSGQAKYRLEGSSSTLSWKVAESKSSMPADGTVDAATAQNGRALDITSALTLGLDETLYVKARAYSAASGGGSPASGYITLTLRRDTSSVTKVVHYHASDVDPEAFIGAGTRAGGAAPVADLYALCPTGVGGSLVRASPVKLVPGMQLTQIRCHLYRQGAASLARCRFLRISNDSLEATLATLTQSDGGDGFVSSSLSETVASGKQYLLVVELTNHSTNDFSAFFRTMELTYIAPDYEKTR